MKIKLLFITQKLSITILLSPMAMMKLLFLITSSLALIQMTMGGDPDILTDFVVPPNTVIDGSFFTFKGFEFLVNGTQMSPTFKVVKATKAEFPALDGQSVSYATLLFPSGTTNPPHTHPRSAELLFVLDGSLQVGFVDTTNKLYTQTLQGLVHFQYNAWNRTAIALSAFGSASAGTVSLPATLFATNIDDTILAKSFKTDASVVQALKAGLAVKA
ncbi:Germin-like protein 9-3 [Linum grandiflorum]